MTSSSDPIRPVDIGPDLVEYLVLLVPGPHALGELGPGLAQAVESAAIRVLDIVVVTVDEHGTIETSEVDGVVGLEAVRAASAFYGVLLSRHDIELVALALEPGDCAVVLVAEDRWAEPLAAAARAAGGELRAGERIARDRIEAALLRTMRRPGKEG